MLWIGEKRTQATIQKFFDEFKELKQDFAIGIKVICSDMWTPYLKVIGKSLPRAVNVLDRFHIMQKFNKAIDKVRVDDARRLRADGEAPALAKSRWRFLNRKEKLTEKQSFKLKELLKMCQRVFTAGTIPKIQAIQFARMGGTLSRPMVSCSYS